MCWTSNRRDLFSFQLCNCFLRSPAWLPVQYQRASWKNDTFPTEFRMCLRNLFWRAWHAYLMELFLQIFSGRNLRWLHSSVNLRNIFSPSELSNNVGYCCFDSSLVRSSVMPLYSSAICETKFCSFAGISPFARFVDTPRYWFCTCICNCSVDYEESPMQMLRFKTLMFW